MRNEALIAEALAWMKASKRGYKAASKRFGVPVEDLRAAGRGSRAPAPAREAPEPAPEPTGELVVLDWYRTELEKLDIAYAEASARDKATLTQARMKVVERLRELESAAGANRDLEDPALLLEAVVCELEACPHLLDEEQVARVMEVAAMLTRMHDLDQAQ